MGSNKGRDTGSWSSPEGWLLKAIIVNYFRQGQKYHNAKEISFALRTHVSQEDINAIAGRIVNDNSILQRGDKGTRRGYESEHPDKHPTGMRMWPRAQQIIKERRRLTFEEIHSIASEALVGEQTIAIEKVVVAEPNAKDTSGLLYFNSTGTERCNFGITSKSDAEERIGGFVKGDIDKQMRTSHVMWCAEHRKLETLLKEYFRGDSLGNERYDVSADTAWHRARKLADENRLGYYIVMQDGIKTKSAA